MSVEQPAKMTEVGGQLNRHESKESQCLGGFGADRNQFPKVCARLAFLYLSLNFLSALADHCRLVATCEGVVCERVGGHNCGTF